MKEYIVPYIVNSNDWWAGIDVYNASSNNQLVDIKFFSYDGELKQVESKSLYKNKHFLITPDDISKNISLTDNDGRFTLVICGEQLYITALQGIKGSDSISSYRIYESESDNIVSIYEQAKEYWNNKYDKKLIVTAFRDRMVHEITPGNDPKKKLPIQLYITPNDPVIIQDLKDNNLMVQDIYNCNDDIFRIYNHSRTKKINPYNYESDSEVTGLNDYWMFPWELRQFGKGDCDDWAAELASYYIAAGVPNWRVRVTVGNTYTGQGHSTVYVLMDDLKTWRHTNSTGWAIRSGDMSLNNGVFNLDRGLAIKSVWYSFNNEFSWRSFNGEPSQEFLERLKYITIEEN